MYLLTNNEKLNKKGIYISKYVLNGKNNFSSLTNYVFTNKIDKNLINSITTGSNMDID